MEARLTAVEQRLDKVETKLDRLDERVRAVEVKLGEISGKLDLIFLRLPSWWQTPLTAGGLLVVVVGSLEFLKQFGLLQ